VRVHAHTRMCVCVCVCVRAMSERAWENTLLACETHRCVCVRARRGGGGEGSKRQPRPSESEAHGGTHVKCVGALVGEQPFGVDVRASSSPEFDHHEHLLRIVGISEVHGVSPTHSRQLKYNVL
jgi:hypothetical protein